MTDEVRTVNEETGGEKGVKLARFDLLPAGPLTEVATHYGRGAAKYTRYGECNCSVDATTERSTRTESVDPATSELSEGGTPSSLNASERTLDGGWGETVSVKRRATPHTSGVQGREAESVPDASGTTTGSPLRSTRTSSQRLAASVATSPSTSTTTTSPGRSEADSVTAATSASATSKDGSQNMKKRHSPGCPALTVVSPGDRNWERGYEWSKSFGALQRHAWAFWSGEDIDAETGSHHLAAVCFHAMAMMEWGRTRPDLDDRPASSHWLSQLPVPDGTVRVGVVDGDVS